MGILLVFDVTDENSFLHVHDWMQNVAEYASENVNKLILANKCDLKDKTVVSKEQAKAMAKQYGVEVVETSAKANIGVDEAFLKMATDIKTRIAKKEDYSAQKPTKQEQTTIVTAPITFPPSPVKKLAC